MPLRCLACKSDGQLRLQQDAAHCAACRTTYRAPDGIIDFVAGSDGTMLDALHYHEEKRVNPEMSRNFARHLMNVAGGYLPRATGPRAIGKVLEIGAGTGLLTGGLLSEFEYQEAVITDISMDMLRVCKATVKGTLAGMPDRTVFCSYSGKEDILPAHSFDLCIGNSVVHHILDYRSFFRAMHDVLVSGGRAVFIEPNATFHDAMTLAMSDALLSYGNTSGSAAWVPVRAWIDETRSRLMFPTVGMEAREDKHIFWRDDVMQAGAEAGFTEIALLPMDPDPLGTSAVGGYLRELGVADPAIARFMPIYASCARHHFRLLPDEDRSGMYLIGMRS